MSLLSVENLAVAFRDKRVVQGVSFHVDPGEVAENG